MNAHESIFGMVHRREILRSCLRCGGLLALGGVASALGWRSLHGRCGRVDPCGGCPLFADCGLPKALDAKSSKAPDAGNPAVKPTASHV